MSKGVPPCFIQKSANGQQSLTVKTHVFIEIRKGLRGFSSDAEVTKSGKAFADNQRSSECFVEAGLKALTSQWWNIHWTPCWPSDPQVKDKWMTAEEQVNYKCNWSVTQVTLECPRWNVSAHRVSRECPPRAGCRPKSHFYQKFITIIEN